MRLAVLVFSILFFVACMKKKPEPAIAENVQVKFLDARDFSGSSGLNLNFAVTYQRPLKTPFRFYADLRCREQGSAYEVQSIEAVNLGTNVLPNEATKANLTWFKGPSHNQAKDHVCKVRIFSAQRPFQRPEDEEDSYDFIAHWCLKSVIQEGKYGLDFVMADSKLCQ